MRDAKRFVKVLFCALSICSLCPSARAGYTHYFTWQQQPDGKALEGCVQEMNLVIQSRKSLLVAPDEPGAQPGALKMGGTNVDFKGIGNDACEPFVFPGTNGFNFCKTAGNRYDEVVTACLIVARDHFPASVLAISSDGSWEDWEDGAKLYSSVLGRRAKNPMNLEFSPPRDVLLFIALVVAASIVVVYWSRKKGYL